MTTAKLLVAAAALSLVAGCGGDSQTMQPPPGSSAKAITALSLGGVAGDLDETGKLIAVGLPAGTTVTALVAIFTTTGVRVAVGATVQVSGTTPNDFTHPVVYTVTAADASTQSYTVTATVARPFVLATPPQTGQAACYDLSGTPISCAGTGQDGEAHKGLAWPSPRFTDNADGTVNDLLTGLMWTADASAPGPSVCNPGTSRSWSLALSLVACLNSNRYLGHADWRMPNRRELRSLVHYGRADVAGWLTSQGFTNVQADWYWTSTSSLSAPEHAILVNLSDGTVADRNREYGNKSDHLSLWPVRTAAQPGTVQLPVTGQITCSDLVGVALSCAGSGQDGELRQGDGWPSPRFADNGDQTVTDKLTGLIWTQDGSAPMTATCTTGHTWQGSLTYLACLNTSNHLGHNDWRLPCINELESLSNAGQADGAAWLNGQGFKNAQHAWYWSSTTYVASPSGAWVFDLGGGLVGSYGKTPVFGVWPVRGGK